MRALKIVVLNVVVFLALAEAVSTAVLYARHHKLFHAGLPPVAASGEWIAHADRDHLVKN